ncbi:hypothetical protein Terro_3485 [Terriglobus roseus DSM 18391]|uniref:4-amino-4-deoxy-L-arabinose transferase n=1 Tax=Terriglobus roseus (strain DSM 18391 / NRRL B-41598 / KBS 63) TaxID=926566 RepID=I3ZKD1_TERRK|nr:hypothetical protein [Terriglobus roseus]AFL89699.1 hypothetical protein Terro_3485 [Terriglobus roseus DSM 18391]
MQQAQSRWQGKLIAALGALTLLVATFFLPFAFPPGPSVSLSYTAGFNNRVALLGFVCSTFALAFVFARKFPRESVADKPLSRWLPVTFTVLYTGLTAVWQHTRPIGAEVAYCLERQLQLDRGRRLYTDFQYFYGPALIYPGHFFHTVFHLSSGGAYFLYWVLCWCCGTAMIGYVVRRIDVPTRFRIAIYLLVVLVSFLSIRDEGMQYTPLRLWCSAFCAVWVYDLRRERVRPTTLLAAMTASLLGCMAISPEHGLAVLIGLSAYSCLLFALQRRAWPASFLVSQLLIFAIVAAVAGHFHLFDGIKAFSTGGYNFPLLLSPAVLVVLSVYVCAIFSLCANLLRRNLDNATVPLALCGIPLLASAFGRCDIGHLAGDAPLWIAGLFLISSQRQLAVLWVPLALLTVYGPIGVPMLLGFTQAHLHKQMKVVVSDGAVSRDHPIDMNRTYYLPFELPIAKRLKIPEEALDSGFYAGTQGITDLASMTRKIEEIKAMRHIPFLLPVASAELPQEPYFDQHMLTLKAFELSFYVPRVKRPYLSPQPILDSIEDSHRPGDQVIDGMRVWEPVEP